MDGPKTREAERGGTAIFDIPRTPMLTLFTMGIFCANPVEKQPKSKAGANIFLLLLMLYAPPINIPFPPDSLPYGLAHLDDPQDRSDNDASRRGRQYPAQK